MDNLDEVKKIIDDNLSQIYVTNRLKRQTMNKIFKEENHILSFLKRNWMKTTTVFSMFVIILTLSINAYLIDDTENISPIKNPPSNTQYPLSHNETDFIKSTSEDYQINP